MPTDILKVHAMRNELRKKLLVTLDDDREYRMAAGDISGPGLALDFGHVNSTWGQLVWNDATDTWDVTIDGEPPYKAKTVDDAAAHSIAAGRARVKRLKSANASKGGPSGMTPRENPGEIDTFRPVDVGQAPV